jgi:hypothetical protein
MIVSEFRVQLLDFFLRSFLVKYDNFEESIQLPLFRKLAIFYTRMK